MKKLAFPHLLSIPQLLPPPHIPFPSTILPPPHLPHLLILFRTKLKQPMENLFQRLLPSPTRPQWSEMVLGSPLNSVSLHIEAHFSLISALSILLLHSPPSLYLVNFRPLRVTSINFPLSIKPTNSLISLLDTPAPTPTLSPSVKIELKSPMMQIFESALYSSKSGILSHSCSLSSDLHTQQIITNQKLQDFL